MSDPLREEVNQWFTFCMVYRRSPAMQARLDAQARLIVQAATTVLSQEGFAGLSMASVAATAGVATGTVYKHYENKAELVTAVFRTVVGREVDAVVAAASASSGSATERVVAAVRTFAGRALRNPKLAYVLLVEPVDAVVDIERLHFRRAFTDTFVAAIADGVTTGELPAQNPDTTAAGLVGAIGEVLVGPLATNPHNDNVVRELVAFALRALGAPAQAGPIATTPGVPYANS